MSGCPRAGTGPPARGNSGRAPNVSCPAPEEVGTDVDFGSSPILATLPGGRQIIVAGQKSGDAWAFDPDRNGGDIVWKFRAALTDEVPGAFGTVVWGQAVDHENMYVPLSGSADGGIRAYSSRDGSILWTFDTNPSFHTVNQVKANRGSLIGPRAVTPLTR